MSRFMSGTSIGVMAAFAKPDDGGTDTSKIGQPERVSDDVGNADNSDGLGLSAEERAQFEAMQGRESGIAPPADKEAGAADVGDAEPADAGGSDLGADGEVAVGEATDGPAEGAQDGSGERRTPKTISYGRHQRDLQALQAKLDGAMAETTKEREQRTRLDERAKMLLEAIQAKPAVPVADTAAADAAKDPEPDGEADPIGHLQWQNRKLAKTVEDLQSGRQQEQQQTAAEREEAQTYRVYEADLTREAAADPAFADAFVHLRETRYRELGFIYADIDITDPAQCALLSAEDQSKLSDSIQRSFHNEQMLVARQALQAKKSPAKVVANLARARGFVPKAPAPANGASNGAQVPTKTANGAARVVAPADAGTVTDQLKAIRDGQEASRSLSDAGGSPGGTITPDRLANMSDDEFTEFYNQMPKGRLDQLMGKPAQ